MVHSGLIISTYSKAAKVEPDRRESTSIDGIQATHAHRRTSSAGFSQTVGRRRRVSRSSHARSLWEWFRCEKCGNSARYYRVKARRSFECERCGHQVYPTAGTPFARTRVPLRDWFNLTLDYAVSPDAVSAVNTQRRFGVTYKTAWRMVSTIQEHWATLIPLIQPRPRGRPEKEAAVTQIFGAKAHRPNATPRRKR